MAIDRFLTGKYTAIPCFAGIMGLIFIMTFSWIGAWLSDGMTVLVDACISWPVSYTHLDVYKRQR